jgi:hypothetical protein
MRRLIPVVLLIGSLELAAGCNRGPGLVAVDGRVTLDGRPVKDMIVNFQPQGATPGNGANGMTDADGRYSLMDNRGSTGAYVGEYKVSFYPSIGSKQEGDPADVVNPGRVAGLPAIYVDPSQTPLRATVPEGGGTVDILLTKSGKGATTKTTPATSAR